MDETKSIPGLDGFDWSGGNAEKNWKKHRVTPLEAEQIFFNVPLLSGPDPAHSGKEPRFFALGRTDDGRKLFVAFTKRGRMLRVISVRDMNRKERKVYGYEDEKKDSEI